MRFTKTIQIWGNEEKLRSGRLKLQPGQWVQCGDSPKARFVGVRGSVIWIAHGGLETACTPSNFLRLLQGFSTRAAKTYSEHIEHLEAALQLVVKQGQKQ